MNTGLLAAIFYFLYSFSLGAAAALAYRYSPSPARYGPAITVGIYYVLSWLYPHRVLKEAWSGRSAPGDDWRFIVSCIAFGMTLYLLAQALNRRPPVKPA